MMYLNWTIALRKKPVFKLLHHLPHLLRRAHFAADAAFVQMHGNAVTSRQLALLAAVWRRPGASQSQVAQEIGLDLNTCSDLVTRTIAKRLLVRERSSVDARNFCLQLTEEGTRVALEGIAKAPAYQEAVARRLTTEELKQLIALLRKLLGFS
jgi:DNA-binding MarR family transcriptional regulator